MVKNHKEYLFNSEKLIKTENTNLNIAHSPQTILRPHSSPSKQILKFVFIKFMKKTRQKKWTKK